MLRRWLVLGLGMAGAAIVVAGVLQWGNRPATYRDAVIETLDQRRIAHADVEVRAICWPDPACIIAGNAQAFAVTVAGGSRPSYGRVMCYDRGGDCYLDLLDLGVGHTPLRDPRGVRLLPKKLVQLAENIAAWVRGWGRASFDGSYIC